MKRIFYGYGIEIIQSDCKYYIVYDEGHFVIKYVEQEITEEEAIKAQKSSEDAYEVVIKYQNLKRVENN